MPESVQIANSSVPTGGNQIVRQLIDYIRREGLSVGDRLPSIRQLADKFQVSPNTVRDGLLAAQAKGLIKIQPQSGAYLQSLDFSSLFSGLADSLEVALAQNDPNVFHLIEARCLIEDETVRIATARHRPEDLLLLRQALEDIRANVGDRGKLNKADEVFHLTLSSIAGNAVLTTMLQALLMLLSPYRAQQWFDAAKLEITLQEHEKIYECIRTGDGETARAIMKQHLTVFQQTLLDLPPTTFSKEIE